MNYGRIAAVYAKGYAAGFCAAGGARVGLLAGIFIVCVYVLHNYVTLNIGARLFLEIGASTLLQWTLVGTVMALVYRP